MFSQVFKIILPSMYVIPNLQIKRIFGLFAISAFVKNALVAYVMNVQGRSQDFSKGG